MNRCFIFFKYTLYFIHYTVYHTLHKYYIPSHSTQSNESHSVHHGNASHNRALFTCSRYVDYHIATLLIHRFITQSLYLSWQWFLPTLKKILKIIFLRWCLYHICWNLWNRTKNMLWKNIVNKWNSKLPALLSEECLAGVYVRKAANNIVDSSILLTWGM